MPFATFCATENGALFDHRPVMPETSSSKGHCIPHPGAAVLSSFAIIRYPGVHRSWIIDRDRIAEAILTLLFLGRHDGIRAWKSFDWAAMERLRTKGLISDSIGKAKSIVFIDEGLRQSEALFRKLFAVGRQD